MPYGFEQDKSKYEIPKKALNFGVSGGLVESWAAPFDYISANAYINGGTIEMLMKFAQSAFTAKEGRMLKIREPYRPGMNYAVGLILTAAKPHIGTDILLDVVDRMLLEIERLGGKVECRYIDRRDVVYRKIDAGLCSHC